MLAKKESVGATADIFVGVHGASVLVWWIRLLY